MRSMTGCGNGQVRKNGWEVTADIRTVNHRFLDISLRLPRNLVFLEQTIRSGISARIQRGHADVFLTVRNNESSSMQAVADFDLAEHYLRIAEEIARKTGAENDMTVSRIMRMEGVVSVTEREMDQEMITSMCAEAVDLAMTQVIDMREAEGKNLHDDLKFHLNACADLRERILQRAPGVVTDYKEKLAIRLKALGTEGIDPQRLAQEVAITADHCAIDEELSRLQSHIRQMEGYLDAPDEIGKKMDFLIQEMNRETNTIGSKASDAEIAQYVVNLKSEIEKLREQIQNVE